MMSQLHRTFTTKSSHAIDRFQERYGHGLTLNIARRMYDNISRNRNYKMAKRLSPKRTLYYFIIDGREYFPVFDRKKRNIVTFLAKHHTQVQESFGG
jgi:hypothetical protein